MSDRSCFFFFNDTPTTEIYTLSLHDALPICFELRDRILKAINELQAQEAQQETVRRQVRETASAAWGRTQSGRGGFAQDRKSTRLNSSHSQTSYAGFCLKKKKSQGATENGTL